jgi:hypothetical protein
VVAAVIGGGDGFDLHRCRGVEHEVHDLPAYSFPKYGGSLAHEFNNSFLSGWVEAGDCSWAERGLSQAWPGSITTNYRITVILLPP